MIYAASLNIPVKKALKKQVQQSNLTKICQQLSLDPDTTNMDVVFLGPKDLQGPRREAVQSAVNNRHPDVCVIYVYEKDAEAELLDCEYKHQCRKIKDTVIQDAFEEYVGPHKIRAGKQKMTSADFDVPEEDSIGDVGVNLKARPVHKTVFNPMEIDPIGDEDEEPSVRVPIPGAAPVEQQEDEPAEPDSIVELEEPQSPYVQPVTEAVDTASSVPEPLTAPVDLLPDPPLAQATIEESLAAMNSFEDWSIFKEHLNKDAITKKLIEENTEYVGLVNMLDVLDKEIETVWRDPALSPDQKFEKIKAIGLQRSVVRATTNSINVEKVISIISTIALAAKRTVEEKVNSLDVSLYKITTDKKAIMDTSYIDKAISERAQVQLELLNISRGIVDLYKSMDNLVVDEIQELDRKLPSGNEFINQMVKPLGTQIFTPQNTATLVTKLMQALQSNRLLASQMEESVNSVIQTLFDLCEKDEEIIRYQANMINLLKANRVEDVIITNTLLKKTLRLFVGADNTGRSATAITWCGILSRRNNSLLIDLTGRSKFREYGITPMSLDDFMADRIEQQFLCVESDHILDAEELQLVVDQVKSRLNYYPYVNIILAPEDTSGIDQLSAEALCIHYITDCSTTSVRTMKEVIKQHNSKNIARKLITIDTPVSPLMIADSVGIDPTICRVVTLPSVPAIRACSLKHDRPYEYNDVVKVFEESFR